MFLKIRLSRLILIYLKILMIQMNLNYLMFHLIPNFRLFLRPLVLQSPLVPLEVQLLLELQLLLMYRLIR
jgi:hypothetical protein